MERVKFSELPLPTWRWLGVNEAFLPEELGRKAAQSLHAEMSDETGLAAVQSVGERTGEFIEEKAGNTAQKHICVEAGKTETAVIVYRKEQLAEVRAEIAEGGTLNLICVQLLPVDAPHAGSVAITAGKNARVRFTAVEAGASHSVTKLQVGLVGDGASADVAALYFGDKTRKLDLNYVIAQIGQNTDANMQVRGALQDNCDKIFRGTLDFRRGSKGSNGQEREEVILFHEGVRNRSVPLMLSGEDEVTGHHAVSAGRVNREMLFYLMSRGLDEKAARKLLVQAMFAPVLERIPDPALQEEITEDIEVRIADGNA